ncbi:MAG: hypothetical protein QME47_07515 [Candidatus Thermoplasmatota archaeon]|nr:hypothetical protein [Candidatus Thermoplasmatota archaeon]
MCYLILKLLERFRGLWDWRKKIAKEITALLDRKYKSKQERL